MYKADIVAKIMSVSKALKALQELDGVFKYNKRTHAMEKLLDDLCKSLTCEMVY